MRGLLALLGLLFVALAPHAALARAQHPQTFTFCPYGAGIADGCGQAPQPGLTPGVSGQVWHTDCFTNGGFINQYAGTATDYTLSGARPSYNVPMCDYPIGSTIPDSQLIDPALVAIPGCSYSPSTSILTCGGSSFVGLNGVMLGPVGAHACTGVELNGSSAGVSPVIISNNHSINEGPCVFDPNNPSLITGPVSGYPVEYLSNTIDGNSQNALAKVGLCSSSTCAAGQGIQNLRGAAVGKYNALMNFLSGSIYYVNNNSVVSPLTWQYNAGLGWMQAGNQGDHAEFAHDQGGNGSISSTRIITNNLFMQGTQINGSGQATWAMGLAFTAPPLIGFQYDHNVNITSFGGGLPAGNTTMTGTVGCGNPPTCTTHGSQFLVSTVTNSTGMTGTGPTFSCSGIPLIGNLELSPTMTGGGATSIGPGGGYQGGAGSWFGVNLSPASGFVVTGFIDDGTGGGSPSGHTGNILTVTARSSIDLLSTYPLSGTGVTSGTTVSVQLTGSPGDVGRYQVSANSTTSSESITLKPNFNAGGWSMPPQACSSSTMVPENSNIGSMSIANQTLTGPAEFINNFVDRSSGTGPSGEYAGNINTTCTSAITFSNNIDMTTRTAPSNMQMLSGVSGGSGC